MYRLLRMLTARGEKLLARSKIDIFLSLSSKCRKKGIDWVLISSIDREDVCVTNRVSMVGYISGNACNERGASITPSVSEAANEYNDRFRRLTGLRGEELGRPSLFGRGRW